MCIRDSSVSFQIDTNWKLGFVGRNGRGKTTFLQLLMGNYPYQGTIVSSVPFDYFPYPVAEMCIRDRSRGMGRKDNVLSISISPVTLQ